MSAGKHTAGRYQPITKRELERWLDTYRPDSITRHESGGAIFIHLKGGTDREARMEIGIDKSTGRLYLAFIADRAKTREKYIVKWE